MPLQGSSRLLKQSWPVYEPHFCRRYFVRRREYSFNSHGVLLGFVGLFVFQFRPCCGHLSGAAFEHERGLLHCGDGVVLWEGHGPGHIAKTGMDVGVAVIVTQNVVPGIFELLFYLPLLLTVDQIAIVCLSLQVRAALPERLFVLMISREDADDFGRVALFGVVCNSFKGVVDENHVAPPNTCASLK